MDGLCLKAGIHGMTPPIAVPDVVRTTPAHVSSTVARASTSSASNAISLDKQQQPSVSGRSSITAPWGFSFRYPLRSLWPGGRNRYDAVVLDGAVSTDGKEEIVNNRKEGGLEEGRNGNWVFKILHLRSLSKEEGNGMSNDSDRSNEDKCNDDGESECDFCKVDDNDDDDDNEIDFDRDSFSRLLRRVSLAEARLYAQMSYLGNLAYSIHQIKPGMLLKYRGLRFVTSSLEKREQVLKAEKELASKEKASDGVQPDEEGDHKEEVERNEEKSDSNGSRISASTAYHIVASAATYLHSHTKSTLPFNSSKAKANEGSVDQGCGVGDGVDRMNTEMASLMATTDSVTAVVAAEEEVKQAVADDLNSPRSSPCEWFICDDDQSATRFFVIQGSESLASWKANLLFEPIQFEGLDVLVHRGIYEAAKGIYEQMLPEVHAHIKCHGNRATFRFTGHSLGGSLSLLINLMLLIRGVVLPSSLLPVITFGAPSIMCGGDRLLHELGLPRSHVKSITMHRDIVPRAFSCNYPNHVAELLKALNGNFRNHPCLSNQRLLYTPMGEFLILQPDEKLSPSHDLLPSGSGLYLLSSFELDASEAEKQIQAAKAVFLNTPHPLEILSDRSAYGSEGAILRDHDMDSYLKSVRSVIRQELNSMRKARREDRRRMWWPLVASRGINAGIIVRRPTVALGNSSQGQLNFSGVLQSGRESLKRFTRLVASQHMHLVVLLLLPAQSLILGACNMISFS